MLAILGSFGLLTIVDILSEFFTVLSIGFFFFIVGLVGFSVNRRDHKKIILARSRVDMRLSDIEIERMVDEASVIDLAQFEKEKSSEYELKYILASEKQENIICMISKTLIGKDESALQCPNCENYYLSKYLLGWLNKNSKCPICQAKLKIKKI
ncbi:MAG: hypothetical protein GNW80_00930 [Asgard group archaeon]|nr:hypothetical protein [Asgard group archaeon]